MTLVAVRHAEVAAAGLCYGRLDVPLSGSVEASAGAILAAMGGLRPARVWSSRAARCREPAEVVARRLGVPALVDERLAELSFGAWEGRRWEDLEREHGEALRGWMEHWAERAAPGGETLVELETRLRAWLAELPAGDELLVAHAGVVRGLAVVLEGATWPEAMARPVPHHAARRFERAARGRRGPG
jgi:alpha-ribazole phosphatase